MFAQKNTAEDSTFTTEKVEEVDSKRLHSLDVQLFDCQQEPPDLSAGDASTSSWMGSFVVVK